MCSVIDFKDFNRHRPLIYLDVYSNNRLAISAAVNKKKNNIKETYIVISLDSTRQTKNSLDHEYNRGCVKSTIKHPVGTSHKECMTFIGGIISKHESDRFGDIALFICNDGSDDSTDNVVILSSKDFGVATIAPELTGSITSTECIPTSVYISKKVPSSGIAIKVIDYKRHNNMKMWQSFIERMLCHKKFQIAGQSSHERKMCHSTAGQPSLHRKMCHSTAEQFLMKLKIYHSNAGQSSIERRISHCQAWLTEPEKSQRGRKPIHMKLLKNC